MNSVRKKLLLGVVAWAAIALTGCPTVRMPELYHPGPAGYQRASALQYDPYPLDDVAPPVAGARPKEYDRPVPEVKRGQAYTPKRPVLQPIPVPSLSPPAAIFPTAPPGPAPGAPVLTTPPPVITVPGPGGIRAPY